MQIRLKPPGNRSASNYSVAVITASSFDVTADLNPGGQTDLLYATLSSGQLDAYVMGNLAEFALKTLFHLDSTFGNDKSSEVPLPLLLPVKCAGSPSKYPMLAVAMEKRASNTCENVILAVKFHSLCLCYWPLLTSWFNQLPQLELEKISQLYPSLAPPSYNTKVHWSLDRIAVNVPPLAALDAVVNTETGETVYLSAAPAQPDLDALRPLLVLKNVTAYSKFVPSINFIVFIDKSSVFLTPPQRSNSGSKKTSAKEATAVEHETCLSRVLTLETRAIIDIFLSETLDGIIGRSVKLIDVNHFDLRYASEAFSPHVDVRLTASLVRVTTCIDSLVALRMILEGVDRPSERPPIRKTRSGAHLTSNVSFGV